MSCPNRPIIKKVLSERERTRYHELMNTPYGSPYYIENEEELDLLREKAGRETSWWWVILWSPFASIFAAAIPYAVHPTLGALVFGASVAFWAMFVYWGARQKASAVGQLDEG